MRWVIGRKGGLLANNGKSNILAMNFTNVHKYFNLNAVELVRYVDKKPNYALLIMGNGTQGEVRSCSFSPKTNDVPGPQRYNTSYLYTSSILWTTHGMVMKLVTN